MKKLLWMLAIFTTSILSSQHVRPMGPLESIHIEPNIICYPKTKWLLNNVVQLEYQICGFNNKLSPQASGTFENDLAFIYITFTTSWQNTNVMCLLRNMSITGDANTKTVTPAVLFSGALTIGMKEAWNYTERIKSLIEITLSAYFRQQLSLLRWCMLCLNEIKPQEPATLLKCNCGVHKKCIDADPNNACNNCGEEISKDAWANLQALPESTSFMNLNENPDPTYPPQNIQIEPHFNCQLFTRLLPSNVIQLAGQIYNSNDKFSPITLEQRSFDLTFVYITFIANGANKHIVCLLRNNTVICNPDEQSIETTEGFCNSLTIKMQDPWNHAEIIKAFIEITLSAHFRQHLSNYKLCIFCSNEIKPQDPAVLLSCNCGVHKKCLDTTPLPESVWCNLVPLPEGVNFIAT